MLRKLTNTERVFETLCKDMPTPKPYAVCVDGRLLVGRQSNHRTRQGRAIRKLSVMKSRAYRVYSA